MRFEFDFYGYDDETTGLSIDIDKYDNVDITNFYGYGDFALVENKIKTEAFSRKIMPIQILA